ncbi:hypothetical protein HZS_1130 [Henneguya salminicola]|nr:hypothetical protein HZS_1130 [Henneguya salminicola]
MQRWADPVGVFIDHILSVTIVLFPSQLNIINEPYIANQIKEDVCKVSRSFVEQNIQFKSRDPNLSTDPETLNQVLNITNEIINVPEILFNPSIIGKLIINLSGIEQMGISDAISYSISQLPNGITIPEIF